MKKKFLVLFILGSLLFTPMIAEAYSLFSTRSGITTACVANGDCTFCDVLRVAYNVGQLVFMLMASVALLWFVVAGMRLLFNFGNAEAVASSKKMMINTVVGVFIIMGAWGIVNFVVTTIGGGVAFEGPKCEMQSSSQPYLTGYTPGPESGAEGEYGPYVPYIGNVEVGQQNCTSKWEKNPIPCREDTPGCAGFKIGDIKSDQCYDVSPSLFKLLTCIYNNQSNYNLIDGKLVITSISINKPGLATCREKWVSDCTHTQNSCHFGGPPHYTDGSYATDFRSGGIDSNPAKEQMKALVFSCGGIFRDERNVSTGPHYHVSHPACGESSTN